MQYNIQSIAASCRYAKDMPILTDINYVACSTNTAMVDANINPINR
jgi:hypothetical protein